MIKLRHNKLTIYLVFVLIKVITILLICNCYNKTVKLVSL